VAAQNNDDPKFPRLLVCEGPEDHYFFDALINRWNVPKFHIINSGGNRNIRGTVSDFQIKRPRTYKQIRDIVFVFDNDEDKDGNFKAIKDQINSVFGAGAAPESPGDTVKKDNISITVYMVPSADDNGHLERLCLTSARNANAIIGQHIDHFLATVGADGWGNVSRYGKAWLRTNLAVRCARDPFVPLGHVFSKDALSDLIPIGDPSFKPMSDLLKRFGP
jgi:hypothetical protein